MNYNIKLINFDTIDSTNIWCKKNYNKLSIDDLMVVQSDIQTQGIGRMNRKWESSKGGLYLSFSFLLDKISIYNNHTINLVSALAVKKTFFDFNIDVKIKWPNDIILNKKKIGGILTEIINTDGKYNVIVGIGLNFNNNDIIKLDRSLFPSSTVNLETELCIEINEFKKKLIEHFTYNLSIWKKNTFNYFLDEYNSCNILKNKKIKMKTDNNDIIGQYHSINNDGSLNIINNGVIKNIINGDILSID